MIKAFIFDFAGVITTTDAYWQWIGERNLEGKRAIFQKLSEDVDRAAITHEYFVENFAKEMDVPVNTVWPEIESRFSPNNELLQLVGTLKERYKIGLLSNFTEPWISGLLEKYTLSPYFDEILISSKEKMIKPDPRFFHAMLDRLGVRAPQSVFVDDKQTNVDAARELGMHAFLFTTNAELRDDFRNMTA